MAMGSTNDGQRAWYRAPVRIVFRGVFALIGLAGCTETPSYFPPCVESSPCPDIDADVDGDAAAEATVVNLADAAVVADDADATSQ